MPNNVAVPQWVVNLFPTLRRKPSVMQLATVVTIRQSDAQMKRKALAEAALLDIAQSAITISASAHSLGFNLDGDMLKILGKAYAMRKKLAHEIYVKTAIEE